MGMKSLLVLVVLIMAANSFAAQSHQSTNLKQFLQDFHQGPAKVMGQLPPKESHPWILSNLPFLQGRSSAEMVSGKDQLRQEFCQLRDGERLCLGDPRGRAIIERNDRPEFLVDEPQQMHVTLGALEEARLLAGQVETSPWSDDYWALAAGVLASRYADPNKKMTLDWKEAKTWFEENPFENYVVQNQTDQLSPSEKYDLLVGDSERNLTAAMWKEGEYYYNEYGKVEPWMGICHGWAPASYMLERPLHTIEVQATTGETIVFYPADIKALGSLLWAKNQYETRFIGGRCNEKEPARDEENGRVTDQNCFDTNPGTWHLAITNQIGKNKRPFVMDATFDYEVWNQPVVAYELRYFNLNTGEIYTSYKEAQIALPEYTEDKFSNYRATTATKIVGVEMRVAYTVETSPTARGYDHPRFDGITTATYRYDLELDDNGRVLGGEWYTNAHPDFLWTPSKDARARSIADDYTDGNWELGSAIPGQWQEVAPYASRAGIPLEKVVNGLFERARAEQVSDDQ